MSLIRNAVCGEGRGYRRVAFAICESFFRAVAKAERRALEFYGTAEAPATL